MADTKVDETPKGITITRPRRALPPAREELETADAVLGDCDR